MTNKMNYEELFQKHRKNGSEAEATWDLRAKRFNTSQKNENSETPEILAKRLYEKGFLADKTVLDAGGGTGRYAVPFAKYAKTVTVADISTNMLSYAKKNAESVGLNNVIPVKLDWDTANISDLGWDGHFDFVFSSMCPATRCKEGIAKMISASKYGCALNNVIESQDSLLNRIKKEQKIKVGFGNHRGYNGRENAQAAFNYLWNEGFNPEIIYLQEMKERNLSVDDAVSHYRQSFEMLEQENKLDWNEIIESYAENGVISITNKRNLAIITWNI